MKKTKLYRYLGRNGIITSPILLDKVEHIPMFALRADKGKMLTDGEQVVEAITIFAEDLVLWSEINNSVE